MDNKYKIIQSGFNIYLTTLSVTTQSTPPRKPSTLPPPLVDIWHTLIKERTLIYRPLSFIPLFKELNQFFRFSGRRPLLQQWYILAGTHFFFNLYHVITLSGITPIYRVSYRHAHHLAALLLTSRHKRPYPSLTLLLIVILQQATSLKHKRSLLLSPHQHVRQMYLSCSPSPSASKRSKKKKSERKALKKQSSWNYSFETSARRRWCL